jgi:hypothetical protein
VRLLALFLVACGAGSRETAVAVHQTSAISDAAVHHLDDPDLNHAQAKKLLSIDWSNTKLSTDAEALAVWKTIALTGDDAEQKLAEIPPEPTRLLALALLREGNFKCPALGTANKVIDLDSGLFTCGQPTQLTPVDPAMSLADPCLRREVAMWALDSLDQSDLPAIKDALRGIAALAPPESQLVADALHFAEQADQDFRLELIGIAWKAGQHDLVNGQMSGFDDKHLIDAAQALHIDGAFEGISAVTQRPVFLKAVADEQLQPATRAAAMVELLGDNDQLTPDVQKALVAATKSASCATAAQAAMLLVRHGQPYAPTRPKSGQILRGLCVIASYEQLLRSDESSPFSTYVPARGLELVKVSYDAYSESDPDGDGDPHTEHFTDLLPRANASLPEAQDFARATCDAAKLVCITDEHEFRLTVKNGELSRLEIRDRPPCRAP